MSINAVQAKTAQPKDKDYKLFDEKGMFLLIKNNGRKYWRMKYRFNGKHKTLSLGVFPEVSLKEARNKRDDARKLLDDNTDPSADKKRQKHEAFAATENNCECIGREWFSIKLSDKSDSHKSRSLRMLEKELFPVIGQRPVSEITAPELLTLLRKIEERGVVDTAHRAKQTAGQVFKYAIATGRAERNPSNDLTGALRPKNRVHYAAITTPKETGRLMLCMDAFEGTYIVKSALKLSALLFLRPGELRQLEWSEVNWDENRIEIPAKKMKMKLPHIVPMSRQAVNIIKNLQTLTGRGLFLFPSVRGGDRPMSSG